VCALELRECNPQMTAIHMAVSKLPLTGRWGLEP
jgi:hypothetical protein